jgi:sulfide:quinone oxidoreductase
MPDETPSTQPLKVVVVGGGIAALEVVLALEDLAGARVEVTLVAPERDVVLRSLSVVALFSRGHVDQLSLTTFMDEHGGRFVRSAVDRVGARAVHLVGGGEVSYDALVLAHGASEVPALPGALTFGEHSGAFSGLLADLEQGFTRSVAFVVPDGCTWALPLYELALMTAEEVWSMGMDHVDLHLVTPEQQALEVFGTDAGTAVAALLGAARVTLHLGVHVEAGARKSIATGPGEAIHVDRIVALPVLRGRHLDGIPSDAEGFTPVDDVGLVDGFDRVYAVGDVTDRPIKQGGLACQQADVTAAHIAARAGAGVAVPPLEQVLRGRLLTGGRDRFLHREPGTVAGRTATEPLWWPPSKVSGKYLSPYLAAKDLVHLPTHGVPPADGVDVDVEVPTRKLVPGGIVRDDALRPITPFAAGLRA